MIIMIIIIFFFFFFLAPDMGFHKSHPPDAVVYPLTPEEVAAVVRVCSRHRLPVVARGAGSGLEGGAIPYYGGVVLDLMRMKHKELLADDLHARVGPGLKKSELNEWLAGLLIIDDLGKKKKKE